MKKKEPPELHLRFRDELESLLLARDRTSEVDFEFIYWHLNERRAHWLCSIHQKKRIRRKESTYLHVGSGLPVGGRPQASLRSRQKVQAKLGRCGSLTLLDDRVLPAFLEAVFKGGMVSATAQPDGRGNVGAESGTAFLPIAVSGGPLKLKANGFSLTSHDGVALLVIILEVSCFVIERSWVFGLESWHVDEGALAWAFMKVRLAASSE